MALAQLYALLNVLVDIYVLLLLGRLVLSARDAHFDPLMRWVVQATDPPLRAFGGLPQVRGIETAPLGAALGLLVLRGMLLALLGGLSSLPYGSADLIWLVGVGEGASTLLVGTALSVSRFADFLFQVLTVSWIIAAITPRAYHALGRVVTSLNAPVERLAFRLRRRLRAAAPALAIAGVLLLLVLWHGALAAAVLGAKAFQAAVALPLVLALVDLLFQALYVFVLLLIVGAIMSWFSPDPRNPLVATIRAVMIALLRPFSGLPLQFGGIDFSPIVGILFYDIALSWIRRALVALIIWSLGG